jgi:hypothetical protein
MLFAYEFIFEPWNFNKKQKMRYKLEKYKATLWERIWKTLETWDWADSEYQYQMKEVSPLDPEYEFAPFELGNTFYEERFSLIIPK